MAITNQQGKLIVTNDSGFRVQFAVTGSTLGTAGTALDASVITANMVSWWKMENNPNDSQGSNPLIGRGSPTFGTSNPKEGSYYAILGGTANDYHHPTSGTGTSPWTLQDFSVDFWIRRTQTGTGGAVIATAPAGVPSGWHLNDVNTGDDVAYMVVYATGGSNPTTGSGVVSSNTSGVLPTVGNWAHIAICANGSANTVKVYRDAVLKITVSYGGTGGTIVYDYNNAPGNQFTIGGWAFLSPNGGTNALVYEYDSVKYYNVELSATDVQTNHTAENI